MSDIPNIRSFYKEPKFKNTNGASDELEENRYYEGYLNEDDSLLLAGYDDAITQVDDAFAALEIFKEDFDEIGFNIKNIDNNIVHDKFFADLSDDEKASLSTETKLVLAMKQSVLMFLEMYRDELGTSMLDNMSDSDYESNVDGFKNDTYKNALTRILEATIDELG